MTANEILKELESMGSERTKKMLMKNHGVREPCFGVKIGDMKKIVKQVKKDYRLALDLYATGNYDAMYLAGLIADDDRMTKRDLQRWVENAYGGSLPGCTVAAVAAQSRYGWEMGIKWIESKKDFVAHAGWSALADLTALKEDASLDLPQLESLLGRVEKNLHQAPDTVRYAMNNFVICVGCYVKSLTETALKIGEAIGPIAADLGDNQCRIPFSPDYIRKVQRRGSIGKKRKTVKC